MFDWIAGGLARFTTRRPWLAIIAVLAVAIGLSSLGRPEMSNDSSEFAPEDPAITASERIEALFGEESAVQPLQVVLLSEAGDIVGTDGLAAATTVVETLQSVEIDGVRLTDFLVDQPGTGSITSFMSPVELAIANGAPAPTTDAEVKALLETGLAFAPPAQAELLNGLFEGGLGEGTAAPAGLMLAFFETPGDTASFELLSQLQGEFDTALQSASFSGVEALPFSVSLIFQSGEDSAIEIPLLLFSAIGIIGLALLFVFWTAAPLRRFQRVRRTVADTLLALLVVMFAITTTDGMAVILGPAGLGLIGNVSGPSSIVSILLVGLGVDYVIHLNSAYRKGLGEGAAVEAAMTRSGRIVGGALVLSALTTAFGFLTNVFAGSTALLTFGVLAAVGIGAAFLYANLLFPAARVLLDRRAAKAGKLPAEAFATTERSWIDRLTGATAVIPRRAPWAAVGLAGLVLVGAAVTATNLRSGFSFLDFVPEGAAVRAAAAELEERFDGGLGETTSVLVEGDLADACRLERRRRCDRRCRPARRRRGHRRCAAGRSPRRTSWPRWPTQARPSSTPPSPQPSLLPGWTPRSRPRPMPTWPRSSRPSVPPLPRSWPRSTRPRPRSTPSPPRPAPTARSAGRRSGGRLRHGVDRDLAGDHRRGRRRVHLDHPGAEPHPGPARRGRAADAQLLRLRPPPDAGPAHDPAGRWCGRPALRLHGHRRASSSVRSRPRSRRSSSVSASTTPST